MNDRNARTTATIDVDGMTPEQGAMIAQALGDLLVRSGGIDPGAVLDGPRLLQFAEELGDQLEQRREERLVEALDAVHAYVDMSDGEIADAGTSREALLVRARELREAVDPVDDRAARAGTATGSGDGE